jgi:hypothetical protein
MKRNLKGTTALATLAIAETHFFMTFTIHDAVTRMTLSDSA